MSLLTRNTIRKVVISVVLGTVIYIGATYVYVLFFWKPDIAPLLNYVAETFRKAAENFPGKDKLRPVGFEIPFSGPGQLATIWNWEDDRPQGENTLVVTIHGTIRHINVKDPARVRWVSPRELLVEQVMPPVGKGQGTRILRVSAEGELLAVLSDRHGLRGAQPSPGGQWVLVERDDEKEFRALEVRSLVDEFRLEASHPEVEGTITAPVTHPVWSPDASRFAVGLYVAVSPKQHDRLHPRLAISFRETPGFSRIDDRLQRATPEEWAVIPLFWNSRGIYASSERGLLRCDPEGSGCVVVYAPGDHNTIIAGRQAGKRKALLLVGEVPFDPLATRAKEIHEVDLATGEGRPLLRLPDGAFIVDLDWIADAGDP